MPTEEEIYEQRMLELSLKSDGTSLWAWKEITKLTKSLDDYYEAGLRDGRNGY